MYRTQNLSYTPNLSPELEAAYALISGALAEPVSGIYGLAHLPFTDAAAAAQAVEDAQSALTYQPSEAGQAALTDFGEAVMSVPVIGGALEMMAEAPGNVGDYVYDQTGSPLLGALAAGGTAAGFEVGLPVGAAKTLTGRLDDIHTPRIFAGVNAKTADLPALDAAKRMEARGATRDEIWRETGWFNDRGDWKFEIGDEGAELIGKGLGESAYTTAGGLLSHDALFRAYPDVGNIDVSMTSRERGGGYTPFIDRGRDEFPIYEEIGVNRETPEGRKSTLLHELEHAIQHREGFATGGDPREFAEDLSVRKRIALDEIRDINRQLRENVAERDAINKLIPDMTPNAKQSAESYIARVSDEYQNLLNKRQTLVSDAQIDVAEEANQQYRRLAGEAEARNVQTRLDWTPEQRRETPPWMSLDVPEEELIYRNPQGLQGLAMSVDVNQPQGTRLLNSGEKIEYIEGDDGRIYAKFNVGRMAYEGWQDVSDTVLGQNAIAKHRELETYGSEEGVLAARERRHEDIRNQQQVIDDDDYKGSHTAPSREFSAPLHDVTGGGEFFPDDIYSSRGLQIYGTGDAASDVESMRVIQSVRGNPEANVTIYRAVPKGVTDINQGDWVTLSRNYAKSHGEGPLQGEYDIISKKVKAKDVITEADSINEFGYVPE